MAMDVALTVYLHYIQACPGMAGFSINTASLSLLLLALLHVAMANVATHTQYRGPLRMVLALIILLPELCAQTRVCTSGYPYMWRAVS